MLSGDTEKGVDYRHETLSINRKEGKTINPFDVSPRDTEEELVGMETCTRQGTDKEAGGGMLGETGGI